MKIKNVQISAFLQNLTKAYTEGIYSDTPANRKLGRVGMSYKEWTQKQQGGKNDEINKDKKDNKEEIKLKDLHFVQLNNDNNEKISLENKNKLIEANKKYKEILDKTGKQLNLDLSEANPLSINLKNGELFFDKGKRGYILFGGEGMFPYGTFNKEDMANISDSIGRELEFEIMNILEKDKKEDNKEEIKQEFTEKDFDINGNLFVDGIRIFSINHRVPQVYDKELDETYDLDKKSGIKKFLKDHPTKESIAKLGKKDLESSLEDYKEKLKYYQKNPHEYWTNYYKDLVKEEEENLKKVEGLISNQNEKYNPFKSFK